MVKEALKDIVGQRLLNHQLIVMTDQFNNYKAKVNAIFENQRKVIKDQKEEQKRLLQQQGHTGYGASLFSTLTTNNMKQYDLVADNYPAHQTPSVSAISTPEQNTNQRRNYYPRLSALAVVSPARKLQFLDREMYSELKIKIQAKHVQYGIKQVGAALIPSTITASATKLEQRSNAILVSEVSECKQKLEQ